MTTGIVSFLCSLFLVQAQEEQRTENRDGFWSILCSTHAAGPPDLGLESNKPMLEQR